MTRREEQVARNEATSRENNEGLEEAHEGAPPDRFLRMVSESGRDSCDRVIAITLPEYERVRSDPRRFAVSGSHVIADVEDVVDGNDRFVVVMKREGTPADIATEEDSPS
jgi:hypothetical protein